MSWLGDFAWTVRRSVKFWWQRRTRGWDDREVWSLEGTLAEWIVPRLCRLRELKNGIPAECFPDSGSAPLGLSYYDKDGQPTKLGEMAAKDEYDRVMNAMIEGFEFFASPQYQQFNKHHQLIAERAFTYLALYHGWLWD